MKSWTTKESLYYVFVLAWKACLESRFFTGVGICFYCMFLNFDPTFKNDMNL